MSFNNTITGDSAYKQFAGYVDDKIKNKPGKTNFSFRTEKSYTGIHPTRQMLEQIAAKYMNDYSSSLVDYGMRGEKNKTYSFSNTNFKIDSSTCSHTALSLTKLVRTADRIDTHYVLTNNNNRGLYYAPMPTLPSKILETSTALPTDQDFYAEVRKVLNVYIARNREKKFFILRSDQTFGRVQPTSRDLHKFAEEVAVSFHVKIEEDIEGQNVGNTSISKGGRSVHVASLFHDCKVTGITYKGKQVEIVTQLTLTRI